MIKIVIGTLGVTFRMLLRYWTSDSRVLTANITDLEQFAQQCGLTILEARKFSRSIDNFIDIMAEDFVQEFGSQIDSEDRKKAIFLQIQKDIEKINLKEEELILGTSHADDLRTLIMKQSEKERKTWSDAETGLYENCVRYIVKAGTEFVSRLPNFTPKSLEIIVKRQEEYQKDLHAILMEIHSMTSLIKDVDVTYREYEGIYRDKLVEKYSKVELIGSGINNARNVTRYDISSAYVELNCVNGGEYGEEIELSQVFVNHNVVWIKGEAGSGKTTFLQWIAVCAAKNESHKIENIENTIPIVIELRNVEWPINLQDVVNKVTAIYGKNCPDGWILNLLEQNRAILLFDGLDEINQIKREEVYRNIEGIVSQYPQAKILLTARNSVKDQIDCESTYYEILPMKTENIKEFIEYWHRSVLRKDAIVDDEEIDRLQYHLKNKIVNSPSLKLLAKNPLLCAMICALNYVNNEQLPEDKMALYEKCCEMLMDARDNQRNITGTAYENLPRLDYSKKKKILEEISYWMMNGNVSSEKRINVVHFLDHLLKDTNILMDDKAVCNAEDVLNFLIERSGIIREPEEGDIDFIHKTFMEFLAVKTICRKCDWNVLVREACNVNWKETIIMCFREMGKENVEDVLRKLLHEGEKRFDDRYTLMASMGASNAAFFSNDEIRNEIDSKIKKLVPPKPGDLYEIVQAGTYFLPFLKDSAKYTDLERNRCLDIMERLESDEAIPILLSYVEGDGEEEIKERALEMLSEYQNSMLNEYNVREQLMNILLDSIQGDSLTTYECMINLIGNETLSDKGVSLIDRVKDLKLFCGIREAESLYIGEMQFLRYLNKCEKVTLYGDIQRIDFLKQFPFITELTIKSEYDLSETILQMPDYKNLNSIKKFQLEAVWMNNFYDKDLQNMRKIEEFELHCKDPGLELSINNFNDFPNLRKVIIDVDKNLVEDIIWQVPKWKGKNADLEIAVCANV